MLVVGGIVYLITVFLMNSSKKYEIKIKLKNLSLNSTNSLLTAQRITKFLRFQRVTISLQNFFLDKILLFHKQKRVVLLLFQSEYMLIHACACFFVKQYCKIVVKKIDVK